MASDQHLQATVERIVAAFRTQLEAGVRAYADELARSAVAERDAAAHRAAEDVRRQAQEQLVQVRKAAESQVAELRRVLEDIRRTAKEQIDSAKREVERAQQQIDAARQSFEADLKAARAKAEADLADVRIAARRHEQDLDQTRRELGMSRQVAETTRQELETARQELETARSKPAPQNTRVPDSLKNIDDAPSLSAVFQRLTDAALYHVDRAAVLMIRGDRLREWHSAGFPNRGTGQVLDVDPAGDHAAAVAARTRRPARRGNLSAYPVLVGKAVAAVLYGESDGATAPDSDAALDVLARHAGRVLETITVQQAAGLRPVTVAGRAR